MANIDVKDLLNAGVHFGHLTRKWNPNMAPYIYMERNGIHIINLYKTVAKIDEAAEAIEKVAEAAAETEETVKAVAPEEVTEEPDKTEDKEPPAAEA